MTVVAADWHDILTVLHETHRIWSVGMSMSDYFGLLTVQMAQPWARRHFRFIVHKSEGRVVASCKLYDISVASRGREYRILGIGAVYTLERYRGEGHAGDLLDQVISHAEHEGYDGLLLYSEIGTEFYSQFGFDELGAADFCLYLNDPQPQSTGENTRFPTVADASWMCAHHMRWLRRQPYGISRSEDFMRYKLTKELYLQRYSTLSWPSQELLVADIDRNDSGYMLIEQGGSTVRILEVIGTEKARMALWQQVLTRAIQVGAKRVRGWEASFVDFAPGFSVDTLMADSFGKGQFKPTEYSERDWGIPMLCPLNDAVDEWSNHFPCPLLEFDHF